MQRSMRQSLRMSLQSVVCCFLFTDAQFIPARRYIEDAKELLRAIKAEGLTGIVGCLHPPRQSGSRIGSLMVETGMSYFEIGITSGFRVVRGGMGYNLRTVLRVA